MLPDWTEISSPGVKAICQIAVPEEQAEPDRQLADQLGATHHGVPDVCVCPMQ